MKNRFKSTYLLMLLFNFINTYSFGSCAPLIPGCWYMLPKIGIAPTLFTNRTSTLWIEPLNAFENTRDYDADNTDWPTNPPTGLNDINTILRDTGACWPKFKEAFSNRVLHVGGEIGYNLRDNCLAFIDITYDRASGNTVCFSVNQENFGNPPSAGNRSTITSQFTQTYSTYNQFGAFLGARYYTDRFLCNSVSFFFGNKVGIIHRGNICIDTLIETELSPDNIESIRNSVEVSATDNTVGGGINLGINLYICDRLSAYIGTEIIALCGLNTKKIVPNTTINDTSLNYVVQHSHVIPGCTGTMIQFPVWFGLRYNWGCC
ncbi:MAG: hypothetical protein WD055_01560 [Candidatus Dependentiae bacterium]